MESAVDMLFGYNGVINYTQGYFNQNYLSLVRPGITNPATLMKQDRLENYIDEYWHLITLGMTLLSLLISVVPLYSTSASAYYKSNVEANHISINFNILL